MQSIAQAPLHTASPRRWKSHPSSQIPGSTSTLILCKEPPSPDRKQTKEPVNLFSLPPAAT